MASLRQPRADEALDEGKAAAQRALHTLSKDTIIASRHIARVHHVFCSLCETCMHVCPHGAHYMDFELNRVRVDHVAQEDWTIPSQNWEVVADILIID